MKPVYKCDYCSHMGTKEDVKRHEENCIHNYDKKSCFTCKNKIIGYTSANSFCFKCNKGKEVPDSTVIEFCEKYEYEKEKDIASIFDLLFKATLKSKKESE